MATIPPSLKLMVKIILGPDYKQALSTMTIIPVFYLAQVIGIMPTVCEQLGFHYATHFVLYSFLMHNVAGNLYIGMLGPGNARDDADFLAPPTPEWRFCDKCQLACPPRSWHCTVCEVCVLKRDRHCKYFGCCVGYYNYRYFYLFVAYVFAAMSYSLIINIVYFERHVDNLHFRLLYVLAFAFPCGSCLFEWTCENVYTALLVVNVASFLYTGYLLVYHSVILIKGKTACESERSESISYNHGWRKNFADAFGVKWYLAWLTPFVDSPLPCDGSHWKRVVE